MTELTTTPETEAPGPATELTADEAFDSLTGFDEIAITKAFGKAITAMSGDRSEAFTWLRALVFVLGRRNGAKDAEAYAAAMALPLRELNTYFTPEPADVDPDDPDSESGKDDGAPD